MADSDWGCPTPLEDIAGEIAIVGVGESAHTRASGRSPKEIAAEAVERALADAGLPPSAIDGLMYAPFMGGQFDAAAFHAHFGTSHDLWVSERGGGMVWAGTAPYDAAPLFLYGWASWRAGNGALATAPLERTTNGW